MAERGIEVCYETIRLWWNRFGPEIAKDLGDRRAAAGSISRWRFHTYTKCMFGLTESSTICGGRWIMKVRSSTAS